MESVENASSQDKGSWGISHVATGVVLSIVSSLFVGSLVLAFVDRDPLPLWITALLQVPLWFGLLGVPWLILRRSNLSWKENLGVPPLVRREPLIVDLLEWAVVPIVMLFAAMRFPRVVRLEQPDTGSITKWQCIQGFFIGVFSQAILVPLLYLPVVFFVDDLDVSGPARELTERAHGIGIFLLVLVVVVGAPVVEEIFFRGFALRAFQDRWSPTPALIASSLLFGLVHFQPLQFPALVLFGLIAGKIAQRDGHLGRAIWAHAGFNAYTVFVLVCL